MRVLCHAPHLSGVGHFIRMRALARGLATAHEVYFVDSRRVPGVAPAPELHVLRLPALARIRGRLTGADGGDVDAVLEARRAQLTDAVKHIRPDIVLIDHYPFSKWELEEEMAALIDSARAANAGARIVCSLRDVAPQTRQELAEPHAFQDRVLTSLERRFDALLVHADPRFTRLEEHFARAAELPVPVHYTGFVLDSAPPPERSAEAVAVLSCGGGGWHLPFLRQAVEAYRRVYDEGGLGSTRLLVFLGAFADRGDVAALEAAAAGRPIEMRPFGADFEARLASSPLSISRAGYNTCAALLRARVPSVVVADGDMSDQGFRARRLQELGLAVAVEGEKAGPAIAAAIRRATAAGRPVHDLDLDGVRRTREILEEMSLDTATGKTGPTRD